MKYTFGNTLTAAERLRRIAEFFDPLADEFIRQNVEREVRTAADLGCGPGYSTHMLAKASNAEWVDGVDQSEFFLEQAKSNFPGLSFIQADVANFNPVKKYDLIYCRFLLSHLNRLSGVIENWLNCLHPGGRLLLDELDDVITPVSVFKNYLQISSSLVKSQGAELYVGRLLIDAIKDFNIIKVQAHMLPVPDWMAAGWFHGNTIGPWKQNDYIKENISESKVQEISSELLKIHTDQEDTGNTSWKMKRIILSN